MGRQILRSTTDFYAQIRHIRYAAHYARRIMRGALCAGNLTGTQATRANSHGLGSTVNDCLYLTNVGLPGTIGFTVGVGNILTVYNTLATDTTLCHNLTPPYYGFRACQVLTSIQS